MRRIELRDLVDLASGERNSVGRLELVAEDRVSLEEKERNGQREERGIWEVFLIKQNIYIRSFN